MEAAAGRRGRQLPSTSPQEGCACKGKGLDFTTFFTFQPGFLVEHSMGVKKTGKGRRKLGQKKRRMRARIRHRKG